MLTSPDPNLRVDNMRFESEDAHERVVQDVVLVYLTTFELGQVAVDDYAVASADCSDQTDEGPHWKKRRT